MSIGTARMNTRFIARSFGVSRRHASGCAVPTPRFSAASGCNDEVPAVRSLTLTLTTTVGDPWATHGRRSWDAAIRAIRKSAVCRTSFQGPVLTALLSPGCGRHGNYHRNGPCAKAIRGVCGRDDNSRGGGRNVPQHSWGDRVMQKSWC